MASVDASTTAGQSHQSNHKAVKNLFIIVVLFTICLAPYCVMTIVMCFDPIGFLQNTTLGRIYVGLLVMFLSNSLVNPIVYAVRFRSFTVAFKLMFRLIKEEDRFAAVENAKWIGMTKIPKFQSCTILRLDTSAQLRKFWDTTQLITYEDKFSATDNAKWINSPPWTKWLPFRRRYFQIHFSEWNILYSD